MGKVEGSTLRGGDFSSRENGDGNSPQEVSAESRIFKFAVLLDRAGDLAGEEGRGGVGREQRGPVSRWLPPRLGRTCRERR